MNKNTVDGTLKQVKGSVKEALGKVTGNEKLEAEGATEKVAGKAQQAAKDLADKAHGDK
ncbi:CsbD family protein [Variovorax sp. H27-G14]|uniref:CsbD family protein n=1 Tax=Variovorax sp. H27-G14 TaxID=3111914 RepID=UPI0038FC597C